MSDLVKIACLSLQPGAVSAEHSLELGGVEYRWTVMPVVADIETLREELHRLLSEYSAVAIDGISSSFRIGSEHFRHQALWQALRLDETAGRFSDGSGMRATLERYLTRQAGERLSAALRNAQILILSGLTRCGVAEVLSSYSSHLLFGDLLYGFRLGIPIEGLKSFIAAAPGLTKAVGSTPASWYWPAARRTPRLMPRFNFFFRRAKVIVGDMAYFERYGPDRLDGKVIFTNLNSTESLEYFRQAGAQAVVSLSPVIQGKLVPISVLEAILALQASERGEQQLEDFYINRIHELGLQPEVFDFSSGEESTLALAALPQAAPVLKPHEVYESSPPADGVGRFAFVIHPLNFSQVRRLKTVDALSSFLPERLLEDAAAQAPPFLIGRLENAVSVVGARAEGLIYAVPMTSRAIMRYPPQFLYRKLQWIAEDAARRGCTVMGLGAYTSVVGDAGLTVSRNSPIGVTSGNSFTVAATLMTLEATAQRCGLDLAECQALVVGATGSIGSICARLLAKRVSELYLVSPRPERLLALTDQIEAETPAMKGCIQMSRNALDFLRRAKLVITTTSAVDPVVDVAELPPGCVVCDVARPPDIKPEAAASRTDILVVESGEIRLPPDARLTVDIGLPPQTIYACLAETLLLALEQHHGHYTLGRQIDAGQVEEIAAIGHKHGLELAPLRSFGKVVPDWRFERLREINLGQAAVHHS